MKKLLVSTDFSGNAYNALVYATRLFKNKRCKFLLLHSFENEISTLTSRVDIGKRAGFFEKLEKDSQKQLATLEASIKEETKTSDFIFEGISTSTALYKKINAMVASEDIDMVIMGTKGSTAANDIFLGSNTLQLIKKLKGSPLLIIPQDQVFTPPKIIAFPTGFNHGYDESVLRAFKLVTSSFNPTVKILHIKNDEALTDSQKKNFKNLSKLLKDINSETHWIPKTTSKTQIISDFVQEFKVDILLMIFYKKNLLKRLTRERVIKKTAFRTIVPLIIIPNII